jgi:hypothetical protein
MELGEGAKKTVMAEFVRRYLNPLDQGARRLDPTSW